MTKEEAINFYGSQQRLVEAITALGYELTQPTVSGWGAVPPINRQLEIEHATNGKLKADLSDDMRKVLARRKAAA